MKQVLRGSIIILFSIIVLTFFNQYLTKAETGSIGKIFVYNWGEYIDPTTIEDFEKETSYDVVYETFDSNEAMHTKVASASSPYDVIFPSEYMISKLKAENLLEKLEYDKIEGVNNIDERFLNPDFDPNNEYSLPYFWGTVGIIYNKTKTNLDFSKWDTLWDKSLENNVILVDGTREIMGMALNSLGYSLNTTNDVELSLAQSKLFELRKNVKAIIGDEILQLMPQGEAAAAVTWSGSAKDMIEDNQDLEYVIPTSGTNIWLDNFAIPKTSKNKDGAYKFINFLLRPDIAARNSEYVGYSTPNLKAQELLDPEVVNDQRFYPLKELTDKMEYYQNLSKKDVQKYNDLFLEFKMF